MRNHSVAIVAVVSMFGVAAAHAQGGSPVPDGPFARCARAALATKSGEALGVEAVTVVSTSEPAAPAAGSRLLEFTIRGKDGAQWEVTCNEATSAIAEVEEEVANVSEQRFHAGAKVSEDSARAIALHVYPGKIVDVNYELEAKDRPSYEFDIMQAGAPVGEQMKVEVDAQSGHVSEVRRERAQVGRTGRDSTSPPRS